MIDYQPDYVMVMPCAFNMDRTIAETARLSDLPEWNALDAVKDGGCIYLMGRFPAGTGPE